MTFKPKYTGADTNVETTACFALKIYLKEILKPFSCLMNKSVFDSSFSLAVVMLPEIKLNSAIMSLFLFQTYKIFHYKILIPQNMLMKL